MGNIRDFRPKELEKDIVHYWRSENINEELVESRRGGRNYYVVRPPFPLKDELSWNELYGNVIYDAWARFISMRGFNVRNGLGLNPLSLRVEKLTLKDKGMKCLKTSLEDQNEFFDEIFENVDRFKEDTFEDLQYLGIWTSLEYDYETTSDKFIDSIWWSLSELMEKDLLTKKDRSVKWCPECKIPVTGSEISTREEKRNSVIVKIPLASGKKRYFLSEISPIWKLPSSLSIAVNPDMKYSIVKSAGVGEEIEQFVVLQEKLDDLMEKVGREKYSVLNTVKGEKLEGLVYKYPLEEKILKKREIDSPNKRKVVSSETVTKERTGIEFLVPSYNEDHKEIAEKKEVKIYDPIQENGYFDEGPRKSKYSGLSAFQSEEVIIDDLESDGLIFWKDKEQRKVEICDACKSKLIKRRKNEWFFDSEKFEDAIEGGLDPVKTIPSDVDFEIGDWLVTRENHWGIAFPNWRCECGESFIPSDRTNLADNSTYDGEELVTSESLKDVEVECPECGKEMDREDRTLTSLFLKAASPWAQMGYPQDEKEYRSWWPGKLMVCRDPERDKFASANLSLSQALFDEPSIEKILIRGTMISDIDYKNVKGLVDNQGHDTLRVHLLSDSHLWNDRKIEGESFQHPHPMIRVLWNICGFFEKKLERSGMELDELEQEIGSEEFEVEDRWILSRIETTKEVSHEYYEHGRIDRAQKTFEEIILDDFAQSYISLARSRLDEGSEKDEQVVLNVMYRFLKTLSKLIFPITPFIGEKIYRSLNGEEKSVFLSGWPEFEEEHRSLELEDQMNEIRKVVDEIIESKRKAELPEKWPLDEIVYKPRDEENRELIERFSHVIKDKAKIKNIEILEVGEEWDKSILKVKPNEETIGKSYQTGKSKIATMLEQKSPEKIREGIEEGEFTLGLEGQIIDIEQEMVEFEKEMPEGYEELEFEDHKIFIDLEVTNEIWEEEMVREIVLRLKSMRGDLNLEEEDEIDAWISAEEYILDAVREEKENIIEKSGAREVKVGKEGMEEAEYILEWEINGEEVKIGVDPLYKTQVMDYFTRLSGVDEEIAETLYDSRYTSIDLLKEASASELSDIKGVKRSLARSIINSLKEVESKEDLEKEEIETEEEEAQEEAPGEESEEKKTETEEKEEPEEESEEEPEEKVEEIEEKEEVEESMDRKRIEEELPDEVSMGSTYLIQEEGTEKSYGLLKEILDIGRKGLCVTRDYPEKIKEEYGLENVEMIWLSNVDREDVIRPKSLEKLSLALENFLARKGGVILLNGLGYLITNNDFKTVLHLIQSIKDQVAINESILLIPVNPSVMEDSQLDLLSGEVEDLIEP